MLQTTNYKKHMFDSLNYVNNKVTEVRCAPFRITEILCGEVTESSNNHLCIIYVHSNLNVKSSFSLTWFNWDGFIDK